MSKLAWRCIFVVLLIGTVGHSIQVSSAGTESVHSAIARTLGLQGLSASKQSVPLRDDLPAWQTFAAPGCQGIVQVLPLALSLHDLPLIDALVMPGYDRHYVYAGRTWPTVDRVAMRLEWLKLRVASALSFRPAVLPGTVLVVAAPPGCSFVEQIQWRPVWEPRG